MSLALYLSRVRSSEVLGGDGGSTKLLSRRWPKVRLKKLGAANLRCVLKKARLYRVLLSAASLDHSIHQCTELLGTLGRTLFQVTGDEWAEVHYDLVIRLRLIRLRRKVRKHPDQRGTQFRWALKSHGAAERLS